MFQRRSGTALRVDVFSVLVMVSDSGPRAPGLSQSHRNALIQFKGFRFRPIMGVAPESKIDEDKHVLASAFPTLARPPVPIRAGPCDRGHDRHSQCAALVLRRDVTGLWRPSNSARIARASTNPTTYLYGCIVNHNWRRRMPDLVRLVDSDQ